MTDKRTIRAIEWDEQWYTPRDGDVLYDQAVKEGAALLQKIETLAGNNKIDRRQIVADEARLCMEEKKRFESRYKYCKQNTIFEPLSTSDEEDKLRRLTEKDEIVKFLKSRGAEIDLKELKQRAYHSVYADIKSASYVAKNLVDVRSGVIICAYNWAENDQGDEKGRLRSSGIIYQQYLEEAAPTASDVRISQLKRIVRHTIINVASQEILKRACPGLDELPRKGREDMWFPVTDDRCKAILATPNGRTVVHMLHDHFEAIGRKRISGVQVWCGQRSGWVFVVHLEPEKQPRSALEEDLRVKLQLIEQPIKKSKHSRDNSGASAGSGARHSRQQSFEQ